MYRSNFEAAFFGPFLIFVLIMLLIGIAVAVMYLINLQNLLKEISPKNRQVEPGNVWLMFIPLFNLIYPFILYPRISDSTRAEYADRGLPAKGDFSRSIGITMPILGLCGWIPVLGGLAGIANIVLFIIFWVKTAEYKNDLIRSPKGTGGLSNNPDLLD